MLKLFIAFLCLSPILAEAQIERGQLIYWSRERKLQWSDFRYRAPVSVYSANASTAISISVDSFEKDDLPDYHVNFRFNRSLSWTTDSTSRDLLEHEQYHFDIYELYARRIRARILELQEAGVEEKVEYTNEITRLLNECKLFQKEYDKQTAHGFLRTQQASWQVHVDYLLSELQDLSTENTILAVSER